MTRILAAAVLTLAAGAALAEGPVRFRGDLIQDQSTGWTVMGDKEAHLVAVTSARFHYGLILPWTEDWELTPGEAPLLRGTSGLVNVTLRDEPCDETAEQHLQALQATLRGDADASKGVEKLELTRHRDQPVLRVVVDAAAATGRAQLEGVKQVHLHAAKRQGGRVYVLHLSQVIPAEQAASFDEKKLLDSVTLGFQVDFMRDEPAEKK